MMTAEQLKSSILKLAMQGKLVPQDPKDRSIEEVLQECKREKKQSILEGKFRKDCFVGALDIVDYPYDIPESWRFVHISDMSLFQEGPGILGKDFRDSGIPLIRIAGMQGDLVSKDGCNYLDPEMVEKKWNHFKLDLGDIVISTSASMDKIAEVDDTCVGCIVYTGLIRFKMYGGINKKYFKYFVKSPFYQSQIEEQEAGSAIKHYGPTHLRKMVIPLPPLEEQKRIVAKIEELMPFVEQYAAASTKLNTLNTSFPDLIKKSILQEAIQGKLVPQDPNDEPASVLLKKISEEKNRLIKEGKIKKEKPLAPIKEEDIPFDIPDSWKWVRWGNLSQSIQYGFNAPAEQTGRIRMVRISDIQNGQVIWQSVPFCSIPESEIEGYLLKQNDILFARTGGTVGKSFLVKTVPFESIYAGYLIRTRYSNNLSPEYLKFFMETSLYWSQLHEGTIATAQPNCNGKTLSKMVLPLPPYEEQKRIVAKIEELMAVIDNLSN